MILVPTVPMVHFGKLLTAPALQKKSVNFSPDSACEFGCEFCCGFRDEFFIIILTLSTKARMDLKYSSWNSRRNSRRNSYLHAEKFVQNSFCRILVHHNAATHNAAMHNASFSQRYPYPFFLQRHRCDALPCFSASPVEIFYIAHIALRPLLPFFLSPQWFTVQNNKKFAKSHNAAMSPLATRDGQRRRKRKRSDAVH